MAVGSAGSRGFDEATDGSFTPEIEASAVSPPGRSLEMFSLSGREAAAPCGVSVCAASSVVAEITRTNDVDLSNLALLDLWLSGLGGLAFCYRRRTMRFTLRLTLRLRLSCDWA